MTPRAQLASALILLGLLCSLLLPGEISRHELSRLTGPPLGDVDDDREFGEGADDPSEVAWCGTQGVGLSVVPSECSRPHAVPGLRADATPTATHRGRAPPRA